MKTHPVVIFGDQVMKNDMYYVPPEQYLSPHSNEAELDRMLNGMLEHHRVQTALRDAEERFRTAVDLFPTRYIIYDPDYHVTYVNRRGVSDLGSSANQLLGLSPRELFDKDAADRVMESLRLASGTKAATLLAGPLLEGDQGRSVETYLIPVMDDDGDISMLLSVTYERAD